jgi:hypothetical protein
MAATQYSIEHMLDCLLEVRLNKQNRDAVSYLYNQYCKSGGKLNEVQRDRVFVMFETYCTGNETKDGEE